MAPQSGPEGPCEAGIGQRRGCEDRAKDLLGRLHPAAGSHLPLEDTAPPSAVAPLASSPFAHPVPQSRRRARKDLFRDSLNTGGPDKQRIKIVPADGFYREQAYRQPMQSIDLTHHFLIAMPAMADPFFARTLTYICDHNEQGALGLVVNRPIDLTLKDLFDQLDISSEEHLLGGLPVMFGGPVQLDRGFVLHQPIGEWQSTMVVNHEVGLTTSLDILRAIASGDSPKQLLVALGYSGWAPGQIEHELSQNAWLTVPASPNVMFDLPCEERLAAATRLLGIDFSSLSNEAGHC